MNLIFHSKIGKENGIYFAKEAFTLYIHEFSKNRKIQFLSTISSHKESYQSTPIDTEKVRVVELSNFLFRRILQLYKNIRIEDISLIYMPTYTGVIAALISIFFKKKYILYFGIDWEYNLWQTVKSKTRIYKYIGAIQIIMNRFLNKLISKNSDGIIVTGGQIKSIYSKYSQKVYETKPIINLYNNPFRSPQLRSDYKHLKLLFVGQLKKGKGIYELINVLPMIISKYPGVTCNIIGRGKEQDTIKGLIERYNIANNVKLVGYVNDSKTMEQYYNASDLLVLPTYSEGFPRVIYEAFVFGLAVLTTPVNSIPFYLKDGENAMFIKMRSEKDLKEKLFYLIENPLVINKLKTNGQNWVKEILSQPVWEQHNLIIEECLK